MPVRASAYDELRLTPRLRVAALISVGAIVLFLPLDLRFHRAGVPDATPFYVVHVILSAAALAATYTSPGARRPDRVALAFVLGIVGNICWRFNAAPTYPALTVDVLTLLMMGSAFFFSWSRWRHALVCIACCAGFTAAAVTSPGLPSNALAYALGALVVGAGIASAGREVLGRHRADLARRQAELADLSTRLMTLQEEERRRISRDLHEGVGQSLTAVLAYLMAIEQELPRDDHELRKRTAEARRLASRSVAELRELSQLLRPPVLDDYGLVPSLQTYLREFEERYGITARLAADDVPERFPAEIETAIYRVVQEALTNVARHARAHRVRVALAADDGEVRVEVDDDGVGLHPRNGQSTTTGMGLIGIRERVQALGGSVTLSSRAGARLTVRLPLAS